MKFRIALILGLLALAAPVAADDVSGQSLPIPQAAPALRGSLELSLADAIAMGLENNLDVEIQRHEPLIRRQDERAAWGAYDPEMFGEFGYSSDKDPVANSLLGIVINTNRSTDGFGGFRGLVPLLGSEYSARFDGSRVTTNSRIQGLSPEVRSGWNVQVTQPLMRGLIWNEPWTRVKTTRITHLAALEQFRRDVMDAVRTIEDAYWAVIAEEEALGVAVKSLETAEALLDQTQTQYEVGVVSKVEVVEAQAGIAEREVNLIRAENAHQNAQDVLIDVVIGPGLRADTSLQIRPTDRPDDYIPYQIDVEQAVDLAFAHRPEIEVAKKEIERNEIQLRFAKNQRLPQFDAVVGYGQRGLAGEQNPNLIDFSTGLPLPPGAIPGTPSGFGDTFDLYDNAPSFNARALLSIPIPNTRARAGVSRTELELRRSTVQRRRLEQNIILEVRRAARDLKSAQEGIEAAERRREASQEQLRAERIRLEYGESTPFDVLLRERDMADAEGQEIRSLQVYRTSATNLDRAQGTILRNRNIAIEEVRPLR